MIGLQIPCGENLTCPSIFGYLTVIMAAVIFIGSVYLLLAAVFGIRMGGLVVFTAFFGWMLIWSVIWVFGAHLGLPGVTTPRFQGPRGVEPHWQPVAAGLRGASSQFPAVDAYPGQPWRLPNASDASPVQEVQSAVQEYLSLLANEQHNLNPVAPNAIQTTDFNVKNVRFAVQGGTSLAIAQAYYANGGATITVALYHDSGDVPVYSWAFLLTSIFGLAVTVPFLDRAERRRKAVLTGGTRPQWLGPA